MNTEEIILRNPLMIEWATQVMESRQILHRGGHASVLISIHHNGRNGTAIAIELVML